jgi:hypothetical protein
MSDPPIAFYLMDEVARRLAFKKVAGENLSEMPNECDCIIVRQVSFGKE